MEKRLGRIAPGYFADIVAVEGDPLADINVVLTNVKWVMKGGAVVVDKTLTACTKVAVRRRNRNAAGRSIFPPRHVVPRTPNTLVTNGERYRTADATPPLVGVIMGSSSDLK